MDGSEAWRGDARQRGAMRATIRPMTTRSFVSTRLANALGACALALILVAGPAHAQPDKYPQQPIRIVVPFVAGGSVDVLGRTVAAKLQESWGQPVIVDNKPGASTMIGTSAVAKAPPDGSTLVIVVSNHATNPVLYKEIPHDTFAGFAPVTLMAMAPIVIYARPSFEASTLAELVALAKARPGALSFGSAGIGSMTHMAAELLKVRAGIDMTHVPYRGGAAALTDLLGGQIALQFGTVGQNYGPWKAGQLKALGVSAAERYPSMPDTPTYKEQGFDVVVTEWYGLLAPAGTPAPVVAKLNGEVRRILTLPDVRERLSSIELVGSTPEELGAFIQAEADRWGPLIRSLGLKVE
jgi:tripartite-type tricarboxylate transporter receptor subunit TctC